ncbi:MAG: LamG domain-containing protein [Candidatus Hydrogenedentota bacterium]
MKGSKWTWVCIAGLVILGAAGPNARLLEELKIGGGYGDTADGGADFDKTGGISTNAGIAADDDIAAGKNEAVDHSVSLTSGTSNDTFVNFFDADATHGGAIWIDGSADTFHVGTRNGSSSVTNAITIARGSQDVQIAGSAKLGGALYESGNYQGISTEGLVALWRCETLSSFRDWSAHAQTMTLGGSGTTASNGKFGTGLTLNGSGYASTGSTIPLTYAGADMTMAVWVKTTSNSNGVIGWQSGSRYNHMKIVSNVIQWRLWAGATGADQAGPTVVTDGKWHHVAFVHDYGVSRVIYVDGQADSTISTVAVDTTGNYTFYVCGASSALPYTGDIDEASVWSRALSANEVRSLYLQRRELMVSTGDVHVGGNLEGTGDAVFEGGDLTAGTDTGIRGVVTAWDGSGGAAPGCVKIGSPNGTIYYIFVEDDGTLKVHTALPTSNANGVVVGTQT